MTWQPDEPAAWEGDNPAQVDIGLYILDELQQPVKELNPIRWAEWMAANEVQRRVAKDKLPHGFYVSTVFFGIDASSLFNGQPPRLWETMIFDRDMPIARKVYSSYVEATIGHDAAVSHCRSV